MATATKFGPLQWTIVVLTVFTAVVHIWLAADAGVVFLLNGLGYLVLLGMLYLPIAFLAPHRNIVRWALIAYTAATFFAWLFIGLGSPLAGPINIGDTKTLVAYADKASEIALIICLWLEWQRSRRPAQVRSD